MSMEHVLDAAALKELIPGKKMPGATKLALMAIGDDASDHTNLSYPGIEKVCDWANVEPRQAMKIINDLVAADYVERVSAASPGRRAVYKVKIPQRPRKPVDNSPKMGATERMHSGERMRYQGRKGATERTPLRITSPVNSSQSSTEPTRDAREATTDSSIERFRPENRTLLERMFKRPAIDLEQLGRDMREFFEEAADVEPQLWLDRLDDFAVEILAKARRGVQNPNAYVRAAILSDLPVFQKRMFDSFGRSHARR